MTFAVESADAGNTPSTSRVAVPGETFSPSGAVPAGPAAMPFYAAEHRPPTKLWYTLVAAGHGAAAFDAWTTRRVIQSGRGHELNPLLRPFANSNVLYGAIQVGPALFDYLGRRMMRSEKPWVRRMWWLPQALGAAGSFWSGAHNLALNHR